jgi:multicomponent K+:H+ antiporter subunit E
MKRLLPHPILSAVIAAIWMLLLNDVSLGTLVVGLIVGVAVPLWTSAYWPEPPRLRAPGTMLAYSAIVLWDIVVSNIEVAYLILFRRGDRLRSQFVTVPLELTSPEAITALAGTITLTPGTVTADISADGRALLVHCLETADPDATVARIKSRYESRLKRIFQ